MRKFLFLLATILGGLSLTLISGCADDDPEDEFEEAGDNIEDAAEETADEIEDATD